MEAQYEEPYSSTPRWAPIVFGVIFVLSVIILALSAYIIHGVYFNTLGYVIFVCLLTWILIAWSFTTLYALSFQQYRYPYSSLASNALMVIFWLAAMGSAAALRAAFKYRVTVDGCYNDGSLVGSETCVVGRDLERRGAVASNTGLDMMSAVAGLSALELILYIVLLVVDIRAWHASRYGGSVEDVQVHDETKTGGYQMQTPQQGYTQPPQQYEAQQTYPQQTYAQPSYAPAPQQQYAHQGAMPQQQYPVAT